MGIQNKQQIHRIVCHHSSGTDFTKKFLQNHILF